MDDRARTTTLGPSVGVRVPVPLLVVAMTLVSALIVWGLAAFVDLRREPESRALTTTLAQFKLEQVERDANTRVAMGVLQAEVAKAVAQGASVEQKVDNLARDYRDLESRIGNLRPQAGNAK